MGIFLGIFAGLAFGLLPSYPVHSSLIMLCIFFWTTLEH